MAALAEGDTVKMNGNLEGTVISITDTGSQHFAVIEYDIGTGIQSTIRELNNLVEESPNVFKQVGVSM